MSDRESGKLRVVGWREWIGIPSLGIKRIKAKIDTGASSSSLHAYDIEILDHLDPPEVKFKIQPLQKNRTAIIQAQVPVLDFRKVRSSNGETTVRPVIRTRIEIFGRTHEIDVTLFDRAKMGFRMLIGREALRGRFVVDSARSYCAGKPKKKKKLKGIPDSTMNEPQPESLNKE